MPLRLFGKDKRGLPITIDGYVAEKIGNRTQIDAKVDGNKTFMRRCIYFWSKINTSPFNWKSGHIISIDGIVAENIENLMQINAEVVGKI